MKRKKKTSPANKPAAKRQKVETPVKEEEEVEEEEEVDEEIESPTDDSEADEV